MYAPFMCFGNCPLQNVSDTKQQTLEWEKCGKSVENIVKKRIFERQFYTYYFRALANMSNWKTLLRCKGTRLF